MQKGESIPSASKTTLIGLSRCHPGIDYVGKNRDLFIKLRLEVIIAETDGLSFFSGAYILELLKPQLKVCEGAKQICFNCLVFSWKMDYRTESTKMRDEGSGWQDKTCETLKQFCAPISFHCNLWSFLKA